MDSLGFHLVKFLLQIYTLLSTMVKKPDLFSSLPNISTYSIDFYFFLIFLPKGFVKNSKPTSYFTKSNLQTSKLLLLD